MVKEINQKHNLMIKCQKYTPFKTNSRHDHMLDKIMNTHINVTIIAFNTRFNFLKMDETYVFYQSQRDALTDEYISKIRSK